MKFCVRHARQVLKIEVLIHGKYKLFLHNLYTKNKIIQLKIKYSLTIQEIYTNYTYLYKNNNFF